jgi:hypothetical protein
MRKIAKTLNTTYNTIWKKMKKFNIKTRSPSEARMKYLKKQFSNDLQEKAYLIGLRCGDIHACRASNQIRVTTSTTHFAQIEMFRKVFEKYSKVNFYPAFNEKVGREIVVYCFLNKSFNFLLNKPKRIPNWILRNKEYFFAFLSGYIDCEGYWQIYPRKTTGRTCARLRVATEDKTILNQLHKKLRLLGFNSRFRLTRRKGFLATFGKARKDMYEISINSMRDVLELAKILLKFSSHWEKIWKMKFIIENYNKPYQEVKIRIYNFKRKVKEHLSTKEQPSLQHDD